MTNGPPGADWRRAEAYAELLVCDRRAFAWEWLRRSPVYRELWAVRDRLPDGACAALGLLGWIEPSLTAPAAPPIWSVDTDPGVLDGRPVSPNEIADDLFDIRDLAPFVTVEIDKTHTEHWLLSDGHWTVRLDLHDGTLLGGPVFLEHRSWGIRSAGRKLDALRQLLSLAKHGEMPVSLCPRERRAAQWILELRVADALIESTTQHEIARTLFPDSVAPRRWRLESASYRLRVQRLVRIARRRLADPLAGPWFD